MRVLNEEAVSETKGKPTFTCQILVWFTTNAKFRKCLQNFS